MMRILGTLTIALSLVAAHGAVGSSFVGQVTHAVDQATHAVEHARSATYSSSDTLFEFHSAFWLNLHHFLYEQAIFSAGDSTRRMARNTRPVTLDALSGYQRSVIKAARAFYRDSVIESSLLFNRRLGEIDRELGRLEQTEGVIGQIGWRALEALLDEMAPIYATYWWPRHDAANRAHVEALEPLVAEYGEAIATEQTAVLIAEWPEEPIRVDVVEFANWAGAYTRTDPTRILISSTAGRGDDHGNLETVFHEAGHGMIGRTRGPVSEAIGRAFTEAGKEPPRSLWHPLLFFTVGEIVARQLAEDGVEDFVPYADRYGLYSGEWGKAHSLLLVYWPAYMAGEATLDDAVEKIAAEW